MKLSEQYRDMCLINEAKSIKLDPPTIKLYPDYRHYGESLFEDFSEKESEKVQEWVLDNAIPDGPQILGKVATQTEDEIKYSDRLVLSFKNVMFSLYSSWGRYRIGAGESLTSPSVLRDMDIKNKFLKEIS